jgi:3-oxoacyl-[acyl-carrier-protein] synthase III
MEKKSFISGVTLGLGHVVHLSELQNTMLSDEAIKYLKVRGLEWFLRENKDTVSVWSDCASASISKIGITPRDIDLVLMTHSSSSDDIGLRTLQRTGLGRSKLLQLSLQDCSACLSAITVASAFVLAENASQRLLSIVSWSGADTERLGPNGDTLFGDGTVSFIVSNQDGDFEILASECRTVPDLLDLERDSQNKSKYLLASLDNLQNTAELTLGKVGIAASGLRAAFCTNGSSVFQDAIGLATSTSDILFREPLARFGHVLACDELLGLTTFIDERGAHRDDMFLLLSWAPHTAAACVLRRCAVQK